YVRRAVIPVFYLVFLGSVLYLHPHVIRYAASNYLKSYIRCDTSSHNDLVRSFKFERHGSYPVPSYFLIDEAERA
ncbi:hypothetical protein R3P38DRAFT_2874573, partial [Favolaschia claudopus]